MVKLYFADNSRQLNAACFDWYMAMLPQTLSSRVLKFRRWEDAQASLFGKLLINIGLFEFNSQKSLHDISFNEYGKPFIDDNIHFNISHSGSLVVCVFYTDGDVGIDIEKKDPILINDFTGQFSNDEWLSIIEAININDSFYDYWTGKEAIAKAIGKGLSIPLKSIIIQKEMAVVDGQAWHLKKMDSFSGYALQVATSNKLINTIDILEIPFSNFNIVAPRLSPL